MHVTLYVIVIGGANGGYRPDVATEFIVRVVSLSVSSTVRVRGELKIASQDDEAVPNNRRGRFTQS